MKDIICHSAGSLPSEAHCGGWEGLGKDQRESALYNMTGFDYSLVTEGRCYPKEKDFKVW
jgi:hypothetical protein